MSRGIRGPARAGRLPPAVLFGAALASTAWFMGQIMALALMLAEMLPAVVVMRGMTQKRPFFTQLRNGVIAYALGLKIPQAWRGRPLKAMFK